MQLINLQLICKVICITVQSQLQFVIVNTFLCTHLNKYNPHVKHDQPNTPGTYKCIALITIDHSCVLHTLMTITIIPRFQSFIPIVTWTLDRKLTTIMEIAINNVLSNWASLKPHNYQRIQVFPKSLLKLKPGCARYFTIHD